MAFELYLLMADNKKLGRPLQDVKAAKDLIENDLGGHSRGLPPRPLRGFVMAIPAGVVDDEDMDTLGLIDFA